MPLISFIVPIFNVEKYISDCMKSIVDQTLTDIEIICVNDKTEDGSMEKVEPFVGDDRIKIINNEKNRGLSESRNIGLRQATGKYIWFVDPDDKIATDNAAEILYQLAEKEELDIIQFDTEWDFESEELEKEYGIFERKYTERYEQISVGEDMLAEQLEYGGFFSMVPLQFFRHSFLQEKALLFPPIIHEDNFFSIKAALMAERVKYYPQKLYRYLRRAHSITTSSSLIYRCSCYLYIIAELMRECSNINLKKQTKEAVSKYIASLADKMFQLYFKGLCKGQQMAYIDASHEMLFLLLIQERYPVIASKIDRKMCMSILNSRMLIIYGAGYVSKSVERFVRDLGIQDYWIAVTRSDKGETELKSLAQHHSQATVLISVMQDKQSEMEKYAGQLGFDNCLRMA